MTLQSRKGRDRTQQYMRQITKIWQWNSRNIHPHKNQFKGKCVFKSSNEGRPVNKCLSVCGCRMTRLFCSALPPSWRSRLSCVCPARASGTVSASWKPHPMLRQEADAPFIFLMLHVTFFFFQLFKPVCCLSAVLIAECAPGSGHMYLHSGAVPVGPRSAGDAGQHGGDEWRRLT